MPTRPDRLSLGFTLIEMLVAIAIISALLAVGAPSMSSFLRSSRLSSAASSHYDALRYAKAKAAQINHLVVLCPNHGACGTTSDWLSFGAKLVDGNDASIVYRSWPPAGAGARLSTSAAISSIAFNPDGSTDLSGSHFFKFCDASAKLEAAGRSVVVNGAGFISMAVANSSSSSSSSSVEAYKPCQPPSA